MVLLHVFWNNYTCFISNAKIYGADLGAKIYGAEALSTSAPGHRHVRRIAKTSAPLAMAPRRVSSAPKAMAPRSGSINENQTNRNLFVNIFKKKRLKNKKFGPRGLPTSSASTSESPCTDIHSLLATARAAVFLALVFCCC